MEEGLFYEMVDWDKRLEREKEFFKNLINIENNDFLALDLGAGVGHHLLMLADWGVKSIGLEISDNSIKIGNQKILEEGKEELVTFVNEDMRNLKKKFKPASFDLIYCIGNSFALLTRDERKEVIEQVILLLKPKGKAVFQIVNYFKHKDENVWIINPKAFKEDNKPINFFVRILEWDKNKEKVIMYVQKLAQKEVEHEDFEQQQKKTFFYAVRKEEFLDFVDLKNLEITLYGDYNQAIFEEEKSNDLIALIQRN